MRVVYNPQTQSFDWGLLPGGGLDSGDRLRSCLFVSLFTDALADPAELPVELGPDRRGWWGSKYLPPGIQFGCKWWLRRREVKNEATRLLLQADGQQALAWMTDSTNGPAIAASVEVEASYPANRPEAVEIKIVITEPNGVRTNWQIDDLWATLTN